jgi:monoamine oxidase
MVSANPLVPHAQKLGIKTIQAPGAYPYYVDGLRQDETKIAHIREAWGETEAEALCKASADHDLSVADCLPNGITHPQVDDWIDSLAFGHGLYSGRAVEEVSAFDYARVEDSENRFARGGYGALLSNLAESLPIYLSSPVTAIDWSDDIVCLHTTHGIIEARKVIITIPVMVLAKSGLNFVPQLPIQQANAIRALKPAAYEHVIIHWPDHPFTDGADQLTLFKGGRIRNISMLAEIEGSAYHYVEIGGALLTEFNGTSSDKQAFSAQIALEELTRHFGAERTASIKIIHVTDWWNDPYSCGSWSVAPPGYALSREALQGSVASKLWFAGEASSPTQWGTVGGAWLEGERAAREALLM